MSVRYFLSPADFRIKRGDTPTLAFVIQTRNQATGAVTALDLTNAESVTLFFALGEDVLERDGEVSGTPTDGAVSYSILDSDWTTVDDLLDVGEYAIEAEISFEDGSSVSVPTVGYGSLSVFADLA